MTVRAGLWLAVLLVLAGCGRSAANHEVLGDRAYVAGSYGEALTEYRLALLQGQGSAARLRAKAAAAARRTGDLLGAVQEYGLLARADGQRVDEAADGLEVVAQDAAAAGDRVALRAAVTLLRDLETGRSLGPYATELAVSMGEGEDPVALAVLPIAAANAPDARLQDSLMYGYARGLAWGGRCEEAADLFEALARRGRVGVADDATTEAARCALRVARTHFGAGRHGPAEEWFLRAVRLGEDAQTGRAAYLGLGDVLRARGDLFGAVNAWERVMAGAAPGDSLAESARQRLNAIADAGTDST